MIAAPITSIDHDDVQRRYMPQYVPRYMLLTGKKERTSFGATFVTSFDKGHRHTVTIPGAHGVRRGHDNLFHLRGFGAVPSASPQWFRVYETTRFAGWAWSSAADASLFSAACGNAVRATPQPGFWEQLFGARNPTFDGASGWFQIWNRPTQSFIGWYMLGYFTAKRIRHACPQLDVFTSHGQAV